MLTSKDVTFINLKRHQAFNLQWFSIFACLKTRKERLVNRFIKRFFHFNRLEKRSLWHHIYYSKSTHKDLKLLADKYYNICSWLNRDYHQHDSIMLQFIQVNYQWLRLIIYLLVLILRTLPLCHEAKAFHRPISINQWRDRAK